jgi:hypothetical protein
MPAREPPHNGPTLEHEAEPTPPEPKPETRREAINRDVPLNPTPRQPKAERTPVDIFLDKLEIAMRGTINLAHVNKIVASPDVQTAMRDFKSDDLARLQGIVAAGIAAHAPAQTKEPDAEADMWGDAPVTEPAGAG